MLLTIYWTKAGHYGESPPSPQFLVVRRVEAGRYGGTPPDLFGIVGTDPCGEEKGSNATWPGLRFPELRWRTPEGCAHSWAMHGWTFQIALRAWRSPCWYCCTLSSSTSTWTPSSTRRLRRGLGQHRSGPSPPSPPYRRYDHTRQTAKKAIRTISFNEYNIHA